MAQTSYGDAKRLLAGHIADGGVTEKITKIAEDATEYGLGVVRGADVENGCALPAADTDEFIGVSGYEHNETGAYAIDDAVNVVTKGSVAVSVPAAVTVAAGEAAYVVATGGDAGKFTNVSTSNIATGFVFSSAKKNDNLAMIRIDLAK